MRKRIGKSQLRIRIGETQLRIRIGESQLRLRIGESQLRLRKGESQLRSRIGIPQLLQRILTCSLQLFCQFSHANLGRKTAFNKYQLNHLNLYALCSNFLPYRRSLAFHPPSCR